MVESTVEKSLSKTARCPKTEDQKHVIDYNSITRSHVFSLTPDKPSIMLMNVKCKACGQIGSFRVPSVDW